MKHNAQIQCEFLKIARDWDDMTFEEQTQYLRDHPGSQHRITARPVIRRPITEQMKPDNFTQYLQWHPRTVHTGSASFMGYGNGIAPFKGDWQFAMDHFRRLDIIGPNDMQSLGKKRWTTSRYTLTNGQSFDIALLTDKSHGSYIGIFKPNTTELIEKSSSQLLPKIEHIYNYLDLKYGPQNVVESIEQKRQELSSQNLMDAYHTAKTAVFAMTEVPETKQAAVEALQKFNDLLSEAKQRKQVRRIPRAIKDLIANNARLIHGPLYWWR
jgi:hypothetical protein